MIAATPELAGLLAAGTVLTLTLGALLPAYLRRRELQARLSSAMGNAAVAGDLGGRRRVRGLFRARPGVGGSFTWLERRIGRAGMDLTPSEVLAAMGLIALTGTLLGLMAGGAATGAAGGLLGAYLPLFWIGRKDASRQGQFRAQLPDTIAMLSASVRAGHSLPQALDQVSADSPEPTASALAQVVREIGLGASQEEALGRLAARFPSEDLDLITAAMDVQHQVGGSLARVLDDIVAMLRERVRIEGDIKALTAQQRYSAYVLALLPVFVAAALFVVSRDYAELLFEGALRYAVAAAAAMVVVGFVLMRKVATIDV